MVHIFLLRSVKSLSMLGLWIPPRNHRKLYTMYKSVQVSLQYSLLLLYFVHMGMIWGNMEEISEALYPFFDLATVCLKTTTFIFHLNNGLDDVLKFMTSEVFASAAKEHKHIIEAQKQKMWRGYLFFLLVSVTTSMGWGLDPLINNKHIRRFPIKVWMPVELTKSPGYEIGYTYQMVVVCMSTLIYFTIDYFTVSMIMFAAVQLNIVSEKFRTIQEVRMTESIISQRELCAKNNAILAECISQHKAILRFIKWVENIFKVNIFFQMSGTVMIVCLLCLSLTKDPKYTMHFYTSLNYLVAIMSQLFAYCWIGDQLTQQSVLLREDLYNCPWHAQDRKFKKALWITMEFMKRPIIFRAGYYIPLSRPTFVSILRCSYSYYAVLNQVNI